MSYENGIPGISKRIGEFLILSIYLSVDIYELLHRSHFWTLVVAFLGLLALVLLDGGFGKRWATGILATAFAVCVAVYFVAPIDFSEETEMHGWLLPASYPTPPLRCAQNSMPDNAILFLLGTNGVASDKDEIDVLKVGQCRVLWMRRVKSGIFVNADLFNNVGNLVARIRDNEFHLITGEYSYRDRSDDRSTIAVYDKKGDETFYVRFVNRGVVIVRGKFSCPGASDELIVKDENIFQTNRKNVIVNNCVGGMPSGIWSDDSGVLYFGNW